MSPDKIRGLKMNAQLVNQKVCIKQNGSFTDCRVKVWRHADGTIVLDDGQHRFVQRPMRRQLPFFTDALFALLGEVTKLLSVRKIVLR
jgi:hypothetical protein